MTFHLPEIQRLVVQNHDISMIRANRCPGTSPAPVSEQFVELEVGDSEAVAD